MNPNFIGTTIAAFLTLCIFSFLYKDNPFYKFAENLVVGVSAGYFFIILMRNGLMPKVWNPIFQEGKWYYLMPSLLGLLIYFRLSSKRAWLSRYPLACYMGIGAGMGIPVALQAAILRQVEMTIVPMGFTSWGLIKNLMIVVMVFCCLLYFFFSVEHKGIVGKGARFGIWIIMIAFGAQFGYTVMARISLLIGRIQFLLSDWLGLIDIAG